MFKVNNKGHQNDVLTCSGVFIVNFEYNLYIYFSDVLIVDVEQPNSRDLTLYFAMS